MSNRRRTPQQRAPKKGSQPRRGPRPGQPAPPPPTGLATVRAAFSGGRRRAATVYVALAVIVSVAVVVVLLVVLQGQPVSPSPSASSTPAPAATTLAPVPASVTGQTIDDIQCQASEQVLFHIHAHLAIYVDFQQRTIPEGIGIPPPRTEVPSNEGPFVEAGTCYYWLHAHTDDGIIHIESPVQRTYTLGEWFDIWAQPLSSTQVGPATGTVIAYVNGQQYSGNIRDIPLNAHTLVQLDVNGNVAPQPFTFPSGL